jgi:hypothetical protein
VCVLRSPVIRKFLDVLEKITGFEVSGYLIESARSRGGGLRHGQRFVVAVTVVEVW